jgi:TfoX/Sxy family transcriptional regulator of competence genes
VAEITCPTANAAVHDAGEARAVSYDKTLADRISAVLGDEKRIIPKKMFGGVAFMRDGKMFCGIVKDELMVRCGPEHYEEALLRPGARPMDFTGRPMKGFLFVAPRAFKTDAALKRWVKLGLDFIATIEAKPSRRRRMPPRRARR